MRTTLGIVMLLALASRGVAQPLDAEPGEPGCGAQGIMTFLCGIEAAEDTVAIPGTRWLLAGGMGFGAPATIKLVDTANGAVTGIYPDPDVDRQDLQRYAACPGPADPARFSTVGVGLIRVSRHRHRFYAVHDGARHSIEVFEIDSDAPIPAIVWVGCIPMPEGTNANAVAPLHGHGVAIASMDAGDPERMARHMAGEHIGTVYEWHPRSGLVQLEDIHLRGGNGIVASTDQRWLYVSAWSGAALVRIDRTGREPPRTLELDYLPDNLRWADDGTILVAGQRPPVGDIATCTGNPCIAPWLIAKLDPATLASRVLIEAGGTPAVNYATGATELAGTLYITNRGTRGIGIVSEASLQDGDVLRLDD